MSVQTRTLPGGELFIGRQKEYDRLSRDVFRVAPGSFGYCYSLIGPNGVGKTTLIRALAADLEEEPVENTYYFATAMEDGMTFWGYWTTLILRMADELDEDCLKAAPNAKRYPSKIKKLVSIYRFFGENLGQMETVEFKQRAVTYLNGLFDYYTKLGIRIILTIDEFDRARDIFTEDGQFFQRLFGLTRKGASNNNLSIITISRRSVGTIAHHMQEGSNFEDAFPPLSLKGFSNEELTCYFQSFASLSCGMPEEEVRRQILFLCGRSPGLLMRMRHEMELLPPGRAVDIGALYEEHGAFIRTAYHRMCSLMQTEYVDMGKTISSMGIFVQYFIGPVYSEDLSERMNYLYNYGFVTKPGEDWDIFSLAGMPAEETLAYEPLSPYFVDYVRNVVIPGETKSLEGLLDTTERRVRELLARVLRQNYPDTWEDVLNEDIQIKDDYVDNLRTFALRFDTNEDNLAVSKLNVLSFRDYYTIVRNHWDLMEPYFTAYASRTELKDVMNELCDCRNASAHLNLDLMNEDGRKQLREACGKLIGSIEAGANIKKQGSAVAAPDTRDDFPEEADVWDDKEAGIPSPAVNAACSGSAASDGLGSGDAGLDGLGSDDAGLGGLGSGDAGLDGAVSGDAASGRAAFNDAPFDDLAPEAAAPPSAPEKFVARNYLGRRVVAENLERTSRGGLRGVTSEGLKVSLSPAYLRDMGINTYGQVGNSLEVILINWDENAQTFNAELV